MTYSFLTIRSQDDEDSTYFPVAGPPEGQFLFEIEPSDGADIRQVKITGLDVHRQDAPGSELKLTEFEADLYLTAARLVVVSKKFDKGARWVGFGAGAVVALAATAASGALAARRRRGKFAGGHLRYPWLAAVGGHLKTGVLGDHRLRLVVHDDARLAPLFIDLTLTRGAQPTVLAADVVRRCAAFRLAATPMDDEVERAAFTTLTRAQPIEQQGRGYGVHHLPTSYPVTSGTLWGQRPTTTGALPVASVPGSEPSSLASPMPPATPTPTVSPAAVENRPGILLDGVLYTTRTQLDADYRARRLLGSDYRAGKEFFATSGLAAPEPSRFDDPELERQRLRAEYKAHRLTGPEYRQAVKLLEAKVALDRRRPTGR